MASIFRPGTLVFDPLFISGIVDPQPSQIGRPCAQSTIVAGKDGARYFVYGGKAGAGGKQGVLFLYDADSMTEAESYDGTLQTLANAAGITPVDGASSIASGGASVSIAETNYILILCSASTSGVTVNKRAFYAAFDADGDFVAEGGYACSDDHFSLGPSPAQQGAGYRAAGMIAGYGGGDDDLPHESPIALAYGASGGSKIVVIPGINPMLAASPIIQSGSSPWAARELLLSATDFGNIFGLLSGPLANTGTLGFFIPTNNGAESYFCMPFYRGDLDAHAGGAGPNAYLNTYAPIYPAGLVSSIKVGLSADINDAFGFSSSLGTIEPAFHLRFVDQDGGYAYPFPDDGLKFDGSEGSSNTEFYGSPSVYPSDLNEASAPWFLFFPRFYRETGEAGKFGIRAVEWNPVSGVATLLDFKSGELYDPVTDLSDPDDLISPFTGSIHWNRATGVLTCLLSCAKNGVDCYVVAEFGTFIPILECAPVIATPIPDMTNYRGDVIDKDFSYYFESPAGEKNAYSATGLPTGLSMAANGVVTGTIDDGIAEPTTFNVTVTATNDCGEISDAFDWLIGEPVEGVDNFHFLHSAS